MRTSNHEKFVALAHKRVTRALEAIRLIGNLSNRSNYHYSEEEVDKIVAALSSAVKDCQLRFTANSKHITHFSLD